MNKNHASEKIAVFFLSFVTFILLIWFDPFLINVIFPLCFIAMAVISRGGKERDEYFKAKQALLLSIFLIGALCALFYITTDSIFVKKYYNQGSIFSIACIMMIVSTFLIWFSKKAIPISFIDDDPRIVQETMYEDGNYDHTLKKAFSYRWTKMIDSSGMEVQHDKLNKSIGDLVPLELNINDVETVALNSKRQLKVYYQATVIVLFNDLIFNSGKKQIEFERLYGYSFTVANQLRTEQDFESFLKSTSLFYYKIYSFIRKDCMNPDINIGFNFKHMYMDSLKSIELILMLMIQMLRQYMNFPVGDLAKYVETMKDKQFLGAFSSLSSDFNAPSTTSIAPAGIAYYYAYQVLHRERFENEKETLERYIIINKNIQT